MNAPNSVIPARHDFPPSLTVPQFTKLALAGKIVDGRSGGLIFGRSFEDGGICALFKLGSSYVVKGRVEGGCFAVNWQAATRNLARLFAMNSGTTTRDISEKGDGSEESPFDIAETIQTSAFPDDRLLYLHWGQVVVSREAAHKHLTELTEMNRSPNPYFNCDLKRIFRLDGSKDGII